MNENTLFMRYPESLTEFNGSTYYLERNPVTCEKHLVVKGDTAGLQGESAGSGVLVCPLSAENAQVLRTLLPWLNPSPLGLQISAGMGDRLGLATPGHAAAAAGSGIAPIFAQQSVRENVRTGRKPQEVMDDALWGLLQCGWRTPWGADADHLKRVELLDSFVAAGYTFFTVDPGDYVDEVADTASLKELREKAAALPWERLSTSQADLINALVGLEYTLEGGSLKFDEETVLRAAVKYGRAVAHAHTMYRRLVELHGGRPFDFEVSVDETATPTSAEEHFYIAHELKRLGVRWVSLAPRFVGRFEKGVDYIGDITELDRTMAQHAAIMRYFGSYKLSLHSGSDKFTVYPIAARHTRGLVHLKTAGTSYLEALRVVARVDATFFRQIYEFARERYETDKVSYHVSADVAKTPAHPEDYELPDLLNQFDAREVLHVTFGSVLDAFRPQLYAVLRAHELEYYQVLEKHFRKHLDPLKP